MYTSRSNDGAVRGVRWREFQNISRILLVSLTRITAHSRDLGISFVLLTHISPTFDNTRLIFSPREIRENKLLLGKPWIQ